MIMRYKTLLLVLLAMVQWLTAVAQDFDAVVVNSERNKWSSSKYFAKGVEAFNDDDLELALDMLGKELKQHPGNGYAMCNLAQCQFMAARHEMLIVAHSDITSEQEKAQELGYGGMRAALPLLDKGIAALPAVDSVALCQALCVKASMLLCLDTVDSTLVAECYERAIAVHPCNDAYEGHMEFFFNDTEVVVADALALRKLYPDDPSNVRLLAIMAYRSDDYSQCLALCEEYNSMLKDGQQEDALDTQVASLQLMSLKELGRNEEAMDLALKYIEEYDMGDAVQIFMLLAQIDPELAEIKVKQRMFAEYSDNMLLWNVMLGRIMQMKKDYGSALHYFKTVEETDQEAFIYNDIAKCYYMLGDTENAVKYLDAATIMEEGEQYQRERDLMLVNCGMAGRLISEKKTGLELIRDVESPRINERESLADLLLQEHDYEQVLAIVEPMLGIDGATGSLSLYAAALKRLGRNDEALLYQQKIVEREDAARDRLIVALHELGRDGKALELAAEMAQYWEDYRAGNRGDETPESCYTIATVFAQIGQSDKALEYLEKHFMHDDMPYNFGLIERDWRLDSVRELPQFKSLVEKYKTQWENNANTIIKQ